jgi:hypothetical protein
MQDSKDLEMIKGYVARLYTLVRARTEITLEFSENQAEEFNAVGDTIEDINTKLQIANSFQQEEIFETLKGIEKLLKQLLNVEDENFTKVDSWKAMQLTSSFGGPMAVWYGELIGFVLTESETSINIKEIYTVIDYQGQNWRKVGFQPYTKLLGPIQEIKIQKNSLLYIGNPSKDQLENFNLYRKRHGEYKDVKSPWQF